MGENVMEPDRPQATI